MDQERLIPWTQPGWFEQASVWIHAELERWGIEVSGPIEQPHSRPWSTLLRVPTGEGGIYFKAVSPVHPYEPALLGSLELWRPDCVPRLLSVDTGRGWVLMRDAGRRLREIIRTTQDLRHWLPVLPLYAELQIELAACINGALTWHRLVSRLEGARREEHAKPVPALLQEFLDAGTTDSG
ncbi:MAG TPA: hypothetical protein VNB92_04400 [Rubrobacter sp.]|nr:hypothetical protein [Rubrobacter sp.]